MYLEIIFGINSKLIVRNISLKYRHFKNRTPITSKRLTFSLLYVSTCCAARARAISNFMQCFGLTKSKFCLVRF